MRPLPADRHQDIVGGGPRRGRGRAAGHLCGPAPHILSRRALQVIVAPANHGRLAGGTQQVLSSTSQRFAVPQKRFKTWRRGDCRVRSEMLLLFSFLFVLMLPFSLERAEGRPVICAESQFQHTSCWLSTGTHPLHVQKGRQRSADVISCHS